MKIQIVRDGNAPFHETPDELATHLADSVIPNIESGVSNFLEVTLRHLEREAVGRFTARTGMRPTVDVDWLEEPERWRLKWVCEAQFADKHSSEFDSIARAAVKVILTSAKVRSAIDDGQFEMIAAQSMLLACEVLAGGYVIGAEADRRAAQKAKPFINRQGKRRLDAKTQLYESFATKHLGNNKLAVEELRKACPTIDDGESPFFWKERALIDRKTGNSIAVDDMRAQLQKARERMKKRGELNL